MHGRGHQSHIDKGAGPELALLIGKYRLELDRPRAGIGLIIQRQQLSDIELRLVILAEGDGLQGTTRHGGLNVRYRCGGKRKNHADRFDLRDNDQGIPIGPSRLRRY